MALPPFPVRRISATCPSEYSHPAPRQRTERHEVDPERRVNARFHPRSAGRRRQSPDTGACRRRPSGSVLLTCRRNVAAGHSRRLIRPIRKGAVVSLTRDIRDAYCQLLASDALALVADPPTTGRVHLKLDLHGLLRFRHSRDDISTAGVPPAGEWEIASVQQSTGQSLDLSVARSDWHDQVIEPLGLRRYFTHVLYLPDGAHVASWRGALMRLDDAARALARGDHRQVFSQCRGALDALPGDKTAIFATMPDGARRSAINALTRSVGGYLHSGRHVVPDGGGEMEGDFPVQASDATFAYRLTQLLMSHIARLTHVEVA